jgi:hypothetical protein
MSELDATQERVVAALLVDRGRHLGYYTVSDSGAIHRYWLAVVQSTTLGQYAASGGERWGCVHPCDTAVARQQIHHVQCLWVCSFPREHCLSYYKNITYFF